MNSNDWEFIWKRQELPVGGDADPAELKLNFAAKHRQQARALLVRDISEGTAGVFVAGLFAWFGWHLGRNGWPFILVDALILGVSAFFLRERLRIRRLHLDPDAPLLAKVEADLTELRHQRHQLRTVGRWYIAPLTLAELIVVATIRGASPAWSLQRDPVFLAGLLLFLAAVNAGVWALNRQAVRKQLDPRIAELEKLQRDLYSS